MTKGKLLLADDSVTIQKVVNLTFADEGIEVVTTGDGDSALQKIYETRPDVVLADVNMPGLSGYEICERLRASEDTSSVPVVLLVGSFEPFDEKEAARVGASGFLTKPFQSIRALVAQVSQLMPQPAEIVEPSTADDEGEYSEHEPTETEAAESETGAEVDLSTGDDIFDLYNQSIGESISDLEPAARPRDENYSEEYADVGLDDEIIETEYPGEAATLANEIAVASFDNQTAQPQTLNQPAAESSDAFVDEPVAPDEIDRSPFDERADDDAEARPDSGSNEPSWPRAELNSEQSQWTSIASEEKRSASIDTSTFELDELDLLEIPPVQRASPIRITAEEGGDRVVTLAPELIDLIVRRVVEEMSKRSP